MHPQEIIDEHKELAVASLTSRTKVTGGGQGRHAARSQLRVSLYPGGVLTRYRHNYEGKHRQS